MTVLEALRKGERMLGGVPEPRLDAEYLLAETLGLGRLDMLVDKGRALTAEQQAAYEAWLSRRAAREPLQYIIGWQSFMGFPLKTDSRALIPRNDTEALCEEALRHIRPGMKALDLCTGTGALAIAVGKLRPGAEVAAADISEAALSLARENAAALGVSVRFAQGDLFAPLSGERFHVIISNPPYIPDGLRGALQAEVEREPALALFGGPEGMDFYRRIIRQAPGHLFEGGWLCLEIGDGQGEAVAALMEAEFEDVRLLPDMSGLPRVVSGRWKSGMEGISRDGSAV